MHMESVQPLLLIDYFFNIDNFFSSVVSKQLKLKLP